MNDKTFGTALITGASTGIGAVYADRLAKRGYDLILVARDTARLEALAGRLQKETGHRAEVLTADLTARGQLATVEARLRSDDKITLLVNNAGMSLSGTLFDNPPGNVERLLALNITAPTLLAAAAVQAFVARKAGGIINISSVLALAPEMLEATYSGTKAFLLNLSQGLVKQAAESNVRIQAVLPGATRTEIWERSGGDINSMPAAWIMEPGDLVDAALAGFDRGETVTIPPLADVAQWDALQAARLALGPHLSRREVAPRYRDAVKA